MKNIISLIPQTIDEDLKRFFLDAVDSFVSRIFIGKLLIK